jgi:cytochrome P450
MSVRECPEASRLGERFDPFHNPYLADPYPFFAEANTTTPAFYSPLLDYWVVTRYHDIRQVFQTPRLFSAANALAPIQPICPGAEQILKEEGFRPVQTLTNNDPPAHTRVRRLANVAFTPRRVAAMETFIRELTVRFVTDRLANGRADLVRDLAWDLPALVIFRVLGIPDDDVARVKAGAESRLLFMWGQPTEDEQIKLAHSMATFWRYGAVGSARGPGGTECTVAAAASGAWTDALLPAQHFVPGTAFAACGVGCLRPKMETYESIRPHSQ